MKWIFKEEEEEIQGGGAGWLHPGTSKLLSQIAFLLGSTHWINFSALEIPKSPLSFQRGDGGHGSAAPVGEC